jgi:NADH-quinone oxidoreductase subunit L
MNTYDAQLAIIPLLPLLGAVLAYLVGRKVPAAAGWIATGAAALACGFVVRLFLGLPDDGAFVQRAFTWFAIGDLSIDFSLRFDRLTAVMCLVVTGIGSLIHLYSVAYMQADESRPRFFAYLNLFMFSMLLLVLGGNLLVLFVGWEGVGLCSYLLIGFWHKNLPYAAAGRKAFVVNRIGDAGFLLGVFLLFQYFGTLDFVQLAELIAGKSELTPLLTVVSACLFVGAAGKSAQLPLFVWLPDAMAGPTPVSALIHAATMVTAGIYLMARMNFVFDLAPEAMFVVCVIALVTAFVAGTTALAQNDIKKVLAYSTVSQLGFMFLAAAAGFYWVALFHVVTHAFFKACLFLGAGSVIHGCHHEQDMRHMGGLLRSMPITAVTYGISTLAIAGIFPFAGYQSKHAILVALEQTANPGIQAWSGVFVGLATLTAGITAFYMARSFALTFLGDYRGHAHPHESPAIMTAPLVVLALLATVGGIYLGGGEHGARLQNYLAPVLPSVGEHHGESILEGILHSWVGILGVVLGLVVYTRLGRLPAKIFAATGPLGRLLEGKYYLDELYGALVVRPLERAANVLWRVVDQGLIDGTVNGTAAVVQVSGEVARGPQTGQVRHYALFMFLAALLMIVFYFVL